MPNGTVTSPARPLHRDNERQALSGIGPRTISGFTYLVLLLALSVLMVMPLIWTISTSLKSPGDAYAFPPQWLPSLPLYWDNYLNGFRELPFGVYYRNTIIITLVATVGAVLSSALVGYAFARYKAPGSNVIFALLLATMMVPFQVTMIPQFILFKSLQWVNTFLPLVVPAWLGGGAFYIFLMRQFLQTIPREFDQAARIDGCNEFQIFWHVVLPLVKPALATVGILTFVANWNDFLGPLIYLTSDSLYTVSLGLRFMQSSGAAGISDITALMAMSLVATLPTILLFFFAQKQFIQGIVTSGLKG
jgi:ABC-type glycerol-3-phosphate transport system permease component